MTNEEKRARYQELCDRVEALVREYHDVITWHDPDEDEGGFGTPPDWNHPMAIQHWALVLTVDDLAEDANERGYWNFSVVPPQQRPYITRGLLEEWLDGFLP